jgi:putative ABC transport system substrate-binding protein
MGVQLAVLRASTESGIEAAFATLIQLRAGALLIEPDAFFLDRREQLVALAARHVIPTIYPRREHAAIGGLMSFRTHALQQRSIIIRSPRRRGVGETGCVQFPRDGW